MKKRIGKWAFLGLFIALTSFYGYMWVIVRVFYETIDYSSDILKSDMILSIGMALISTLGFYLKIVLTTAQNKAQK